MEATSPRNIREMPISYNSRQRPQRTSGIEGCEIIPAPSPLAVSPRPPHKEAEEGGFLQFPGPVFGSKFPPSLTRSVDLVQPANFYISFFWPFSSVYADLFRASFVGCADYFIPIVSRVICWLRGLAKAFWLHRKIRSISSRSLP